jgi:hypothetical protein
MSTPGTVTLGELKALGAFVRQQDLLERVRVLVAKQRVPPAFALTAPPGEAAAIARQKPAGRAGTRASTPATRAPVDDTVDLFVERRWRRVRVVRFDGEHLTWRDGREEHQWLLDRDAVAPAGRYTAWQGDASRAQDARLREGFRPLRRHEVMRDATLESVDGDYVTFRVRSFDPNARWVEHLTEDAYTFHVADPRVEVPGVRPLPHSHHAPIAVSHRWLTREHPDPQGAQFAEFLTACEREQLHDAQTFLIDWCALPQRPRTPREAAAFRRELPVFQAHFGRQVMVLNEGAEDYRLRAWCMLELMAASVGGHVLGADAMSPALADAHGLAREYTKIDRFHWDNIRRSRADAAAFVRDPVHVAIHNARVNKHREIVEMFEQQMRVREPRDMPVVVRLLKELVFGEQPPARTVRPATRRRTR